MSEKSKILIIDDEIELLKSCVKILQHNNHTEIVTLNDGITASEEIENGGFDVIISDLTMPEMSGMELLRKTRDTTPDTPFIIFSAHGDTKTAVQAMREGAFDFIEKPFKAERLRTVVEKALGSRRLQKSKPASSAPEQESQAGFENIVGKSPAMQRVFDLIQRVAKGESNVTVTGESGTGKELVARSIHALSHRKDKPFVPVNCAAFPEHLFESELFGHEKGSFTGAYRRKHGLVEFAEGGTFFLDEICELSQLLQVKLLRMLQDKKIRRVGGTDLIEVDVRIISASNRNLEEAVRQGALREDLYYRLNVVSIHLPPLRERKEDIPSLGTHFLEKYAKITPKEIESISNDALQCLEGYPWPGNVRELENAIERAITLARTESLQVEDLPANIITSSKNHHSSPYDLPLKKAKSKVIAEFEREYVLRMLTRHNGNITQAAKDSGIDRRTLHRLVKRYGINSKNWK